MIPSQVAFLAPPAEFAAWLASAAFVVLLFNQIAKAYYTLRGRPTPRESAAAEAALSARIGRLEQRHDSGQRDCDRRLDALEAAQHAIRERQSVEVGKLYTRITTDVDRLYNRLNAVAESSALISGQLCVIRSLLDQRAAALASVLTPLPPPPPEPHHARDD